MNLACMAHGEPVAVRANKPCPQCAAGAHAWRQRRLDRRAKASQTSQQNAAGFASRKTTR
jgi:hypothetical protein